MNNAQALPDLLREIVAYCREAGHGWSSLDDADSLLRTTSQPGGVPEGVDIATCRELAELVVNDHSVQTDHLGFWMCIHCHQFKNLRPQHKPGCLVDRAFALLTASPTPPAAMGSDAERAAQATPTPAALDACINAMDLALEQLEWTASGHSEDSMPDALVEAIGALRSVRKAALSAAPTAAVEVAS